MSLSDSFSLFDDALSISSDDDDVALWKESGIATNYKSGTNEDTTTTTTTSSSSSSARDTIKKRKKTTSESNFEISEISNDIIGQESNTKKRKGNESVFLDDDDDYDSDEDDDNYTSKILSSSNNKRKDPLYDENDDEDDDEDDEDDLPIAHYKSKSKKIKKSNVAKAKPSSSSSAAEKFTKAKTKRKKTSSSAKSEKSTKRKKKPSSSKVTTKHHQKSQTKTPPGKSSSTPPSSSTSKKKIISRIYNLEKIIHPTTFMNDYNKGSQQDENEQDKDRGYKIGYHCVPITETKDGSEKLLPQRLFYERKSHSSTSSSNTSLGNKKLKQNTDQEDEEIELLLEKGAAPILRRLGWKINGQYSTFKLKVDNTTTYIIGREEMVSSLKRIQPTLLNKYGDFVFGGSGQKNDSILENLILEDILLKRNERLVDLTKAVEDSVEYYPNDQTNEWFHPSSSSSKKKGFLDQTLHDEKMGQDDGEDEDVGLINFDDESKSQHTSEKAVVEVAAVAASIKSSQTKNDKKSSKLPSTLKSSKRIGKKFIKITQILPRRDEILHKKAFQEIHSSIAKQSERRLLHINSYSVKNDPSSIALVIKGEENLVTKARQRVLRGVKTYLRQENARMIMKKGTSYELQILIDATKKLGIQIVNIDNFEGVPFLCKANGQMKEILGRAADKGAVLREVKCFGSKKKFVPAKQRTTVFEEANIRYAKSKKEENKLVVAKICLNGRAHLLQLNLERVVDGRSGIHRRNPNLKGPLNLPRSLPRSAGSSSRNILLNGQNGHSLKSNGHSSKQAKIPSPKNGSEIEKKSNDSQQSSLAKKPRKDTPRSHFSEKMKLVKQIEFAPFKISHMLANGQMWDAHKRLIGEECDENCPCPSMIDKLTKTVIRHYLKKENEKGQFKNPFGLKETNSMIGFANRFCDKFYAKVRSTFPKDTHQQTLQKLCSMWEAHCKQRRFSTICKEGCECGSSWNELFLPVCKKCDANNGSTNDHTATINGKKSTAANNRYDTAPKNRKEEFHLIFKPCKINLGLFFTNDNEGNCVVSSIEPTGYAIRRNRNINVGMIVAGIAIGNDERYSTNRWQDLERAYNELKPSNLKMQLWLSKNDVNNSNKSVKDCKNDWSSSGGWIGDDFGWAGGARIAKSNRHSQGEGMTKLGRQEIHINFKEKLSQMNAPQSIASTNDPLLREKFKTVTKNSSTSIDSRDNSHFDKADKLESETELGMAVPYESEVPLQHNNPVRVSEYQPNSILRTNHSKRTPKNKRVQIIDDRNNDMHCQRSRTAIFHLMREAVVNPKQHVRSLVHQLKRAPSSKDQFLSLRKTLQEKLKEFEYNKEHADDQDEYDLNAENIDALLPKKRALLIFETVGEIVDMARYINKPSLLTFTLAETTINASCKNDEQSNSNIFCTLAINNNQVASTGKVKFRENINWLEKPRLNELTALHAENGNNDFYGKDEATITLVKEDTDGGNVRLLSSVTKKISEIAAHTKVKSSDFLTLKFDKSTFLEKGSIVLMPTKAEAQPTKIIEKKGEIVQKLKEVINWIERFQTDYQDMENLISADMTSFDNVSLLHVAVLCCQKDLVGDLLRIGARTDITSKPFGSPIHYARMLVKEVIKDKDRDSKRRTYHEIIQMLDKN